VAREEGRHVEGPKHVPVMSLQNKGLYMLLGYMMRMRTVLLFGDQAKLCVVVVGD